MLNQLLAISGEIIEAGLLTFVLGMLVTFLGIAIIVVFVSIAGNIFNKTAKEPKLKVEKKEIKVESVKEVQDEEISDTVKAAIIAAISAYYFTGEESKAKCDFVVKRIKRI